MSYWTPTPLFAGRTVFVLGGGPSLSCFDVRRLDPTDVIAVNTAGEMMPNAAVLFWRDASWASANEAVIDAWPALRITTHASRGLSAHVVQIERRNDFPPPGSMAVRWGPSSGHVAVALALAMGAAKIVLVGFDGRLVKGRSHWHDRYRAIRRPATYERFNAAWSGWRAAAARRRVEIVNATSGSAIDEFPIVALDALLPRQAA